MKNILLLINQLHIGGAEKTVAGLSLELSKKYNVFLVTFNKTDGMFDHAGKHIFIDLPFSRNSSENNAIARFRRLVALIFQLRKIKKDNNIQVSISFLEASNIANILSKRKEKVILSVRSHLSSEFKDDKRLYVFKILIKQLYNSAFRIVAPSKLIKKDLSEHFSVWESKISVIYNFTDRARINRLMKEGITNDFESAIFQSPVLIDVGRITHAKAQSSLLPVFKKVKEAVPTIKLVILGEGPLKDKLTNLAREQGLSLYDSFSNEPPHKNNDIFLLGFKANPFPYLSKSALLVSTSVYEGFPNAMVEAMACGLPVISSDCPSGPREILAPDTDINEVARTVEYCPYGILLPVLKNENGRLEKDINSWAIAIEALLRDDEKRAFYADKASSRSESFNKETIIQQWIDLIES
jgi:glycosyltransferase involved in cell wall biosynthesis